MVTGRKAKMNLKELKSMEDVLRVTGGGGGGAPARGGRGGVADDAVVDVGVLIGYGVEFFGDGEGDDVGALLGVVAAVVEEADGQGLEGVAGDAVELGLVGVEILIAGGDGGYVDEDDVAAALVVVVEVLDEGAGVGALRWVLEGGGGIAEGAGLGGRGEEGAAVGLDEVFVGTGEVGGVEPDGLDGIVGAEAGGVSGEGDGLLGMGEEDVAGLGGGAVAEELKQPFGVDGVVPGAVLTLEVIGRELHEEDAGLGVVGEEVVEGEVIGDGEDGVGDGDVAGFVAGVALDDVGVDAGHGGGVAEDEDIAVLILHVEDGVVGLDPDAGAVFDEKVGLAYTDEDRDRHEGEKKNKEAITEGKNGRLAF
jgi:hypothetical protein